jgi:hypothetical protein
VDAGQPQLDYGGADELDDAQRRDVICRIVSRQALVEHDSRNAAVCDPQCDLTSLESDAYGCIRAEGAGCGKVRVGARGRRLHARNSDFETQGIELRAQALNDVRFDLAAMDDRDARGRKTRGRAAQNGCGAKQAS